MEIRIVLVFFAILLMIIIPLFWENDIIRQILSVILMVLGVLMLITNFYKMKRERETTHKIKK